MHKSMYNSIGPRFWYKNLSPNSIMQTSILCGDLFRVQLKELIRYSQYIIRIEKNTSLHIQHLADAFIQNDIVQLEQFRLKGLCQVPNSAKLVVVKPSLSNTKTYACIYVYTQTNTYLRTYIHIPIQTHTYIYCTHTLMHLHTYIYPHKYTCIHTHIYCT